MVTTDFQRARSPLQQQQRRDAILATAREMLAELPPEEWSLRELSRRVGLSKSNVVRYFPTREAVFLAVLAVDLGAWLDDVERRLPGLDRRRSVHTRCGQVATAIATSLGDHPRLCDLLAASSAVLERNIPVETAREFKTRALSHLERLASFVQAVVPELDPDRAGRLAGTVWALVAGAWPMSNPSPSVATVLAEPEFASMCVDFVPDLARALTALLHGLTLEP